MSRPRASRDLPEHARALASRFVETLVEALSEEGARANLKPLRVTGTSRSGGLRVDRGEDGVRERTISLTDLAWVLLADQATAEREPTEADVNRARYPPGTPRASTRWVDTRIALEILAWAKRNVSWRTPPEP